MTAWSSSLLSLRRVIKTGLFIACNLRYVSQSRLRRCECCLRWTLFVSFSKNDEFKICVRCRANLRYEMLARYLRSEIGGIEDKFVVELDPHSPLRRQLSRAKRYIRTYYSADGLPGSVRQDGAQCEDATRFSFADNSVDIVISSDVLEHVPDLAAAFTESARVLKVGGCHLFTVPSAAKTKKKAELRDGKIHYHAAPEYHNDPLNPDGILVFWDIGTDMADMFSTLDLRIEIVGGPEGTDGRLLWRATKRQ